MNSDQPRLFSEEELRELPVAELARLIAAPVPEIGEVDRELRRNLRWQRRDAQDELERRAWEGRQKVHGNL